MGLILIVLSTVYDLAVSIALTALPSNGPSSLMDASAGDGYCRVLPEIKIFGKGEHSDLYSVPGRRFLVPEVIVQAFSASCLWTVCLSMAQVEIPRFAPLKVVRVLAAVLNSARSPAASSTDFAI